MPERKPFENFEYKVFDINKEKRFNRIIFGAPGTGKSFKIDGDKDKLEKLGGFERVTFHPNYSYSQFVGTYKPVSENKDIEYKYVEGPFMRLLTAALENAKDSNKDNRKRYLLIVEEINRANVATVFGDMFQLLDRNTDGVSDYEIQTSEDVRKYLASKLGGDGSEDKYKTLKLPNNFYIWASMNSADQGVQPMDAAFKRRWDFEYLPLDEHEKEISNYKLPFPKGDKYKLESWMNVRRTINELLKKIGNINEDKLLGPFFISDNSLKKYSKEKDEEINDEEANNFAKLFKSKVLMYLYEDVCKINPSLVFPKVKSKNGNGKPHFSDVCDAFDSNGIGIFEE